MPPTTPGVAADAPPAAAPPDGSPAEDAPADAPADGGPDEVRPAGTRAGTVSRAHPEVVGDAALERATGRSRSTWHALLDAAGAAGWRHRDTATWLAREHGVDPWWCQAITVGYEQARGIRVPGQRGDGSFACSVSRVLPVERERAWALVADPDLRVRWLDVDARVTGETRPASVRWALPDGTRAVGRVEPVRAGATRVVVQHARLTVPEAVTASRAAWADRLGRLVQAATAAPG